MVYDRLSIAPQTQSPIALADRTIPQNRYDKDNEDEPSAGDHPMTISRNPGITPHITIDRLEYLDRQEALFDAAKPQLLTTYPGEFIAFENGLVLDHDTSEQALAQRVFAQRPNQDLLIRQVLEQEPILMVRGARFA
jgi:hypothetical protein